MMSTINTPVLIIGAGPAGLAVAGHLRRLNIPFEIIERGRHVGESWHKHYDRLHLHTVKELSSLPGLEFPADYPRYVSREQLIAYFERYAAHFDIRPHFGMEAVSIDRRAAGDWRVEMARGQDFTARRVVVATGVNRVPYRPYFDGEENFQGEVIHSWDYRNPAPFAGRRVLVVGMGNTGAEIALDLCEAGVETVLSVRSPVNIVPRDVFGRPTQLTALKLAKLPAWLGDAVGTLIRRLVVGNLTRYGIQTPKMPPARQLRVQGKTPVIDLGTLREIKAGRIRVRPGIDHFTPDGVVFKDSSQEVFDAVILATGYRARIQDLLDEIEPKLDQYDAPRGCVGEGPFEGLYFIGFDNYTPGGILGTIRRDAAVVAAAISEAMQPVT